MQKKAVLLLSGGLDSTLALRIMQEQDIEMEAINFKTAFGCCKDDALEMARQFGVRVTILSVSDDYFKLIEKPKYGWGKGINPCVDCRSYMFKLARKYMDVCGASFLVSGEVLGQRPMSQQRHQLGLIEKECDLTGRILRPLSAKLLDPTLAEEAGIVDRSKLYGISGRSRRELLDLAKKYNIEEPPSPSTGCLLTEPDFAKKVRDMFSHTKDYERWDFEVLKVGRHFRLDEDVKAVLGRDAEENRRLEVFQREDTVMFVPHSFRGPTALLVGKVIPEHEEQVLRMIMHYSKADKAGTHTIERSQGDDKTMVEFQCQGMEQEALLEMRV